MLLQEKLKRFKVILGSQSPRRKELLKGLGIPFDTLSFNIDEQYPTALKEKEITEYLCTLKAKAFQFKTEKEILITADTIVWHNGKALEKPKDRGEAIEMLTTLSNTMHKVITSVGITSMCKQIIFSDVTEVCFGELSVEDITFYVDNLQPYDKAGAYGIQEWIGYIGVKSIKGSYFTVMGLPLYPLYNILKVF